MYIVAIAWIYVVLMMSITERTAVAGVMTFLFYGVIPLTIVLYLMGTPQRKRNRHRAEQVKGMLTAKDATMQFNDELVESNRESSQASNQDSEQKTDQKIDSTLLTEPALVEPALQPKQQPDTETIGKK